MNSNTENRQTSLHRHHITYSIWQNIDVPVQVEMKSQNLLHIVHDFLLLLSISFPLSYSSNLDQFTTCATNTTRYHCGYIHGISYPFWGGIVPEYCGHHAFHLQCQANSSPVIDIGSHRFSVLDINQITYIMNIVPSRLWNPCPENDEDPKYPSLNNSNFVYARTVSFIMLAYECPMIASLLRYNITCASGSERGTNNYSYYVDEIIWSREKQNLQYCKTHTMVPVSDVVRGDLLGGSMTLEAALNQSVEVEYRANRYDCTRCEVSLHGLCGSDPTTRKFLCFGVDGHQQGNWTTSSPELNSDKNESKQKKLSLGILLAVAMMTSSCIIAFSIWSIRKIISSNQMTPFFKMRDNNDKNIEILIRKCEYVAPKRYSYSDIKKMTNSFEVKLGEGGYGSVYKGRLQDGHLVAVKMLKESKGIGEEFINEVASISQTCHVNIVSFIGFCFQDKKRALVYEFMANGSLDKFLYDGNTLKACLSWKILYQIAIGIARGLEYLHRGCSTRILHFDIKPHNILLDEDFCPKIADFGLSKLCSRKQSIVSMQNARGTIGYIAPEVFSRTFGKVSHKSDVYSYGMLVLQMVGGTKNENVKEHGTSKDIFFPHWIYKRLELGNDLGLCSVETEEDDELARTLVLVGLWCIQTNPSHRPSISEVLSMLEVCREALTIPPQPFHFSPQNSDTYPSPT